MANTNSIVEVGRGPPALLLVAFLVGLFLRCFGVDTHELQYDEAATSYFATLPFPDLWGSPALLEPNPPLFYSLAWLVIHAGGSAEHIRYISVIAGSLCVPVAWLIARHAAGDLAGASAALLVATSPPHIAISQYARAYALLILCVMFAFLCVMRARRLASAMSPAARTGRLWWWWGYVIAAAVALYTHHTAILILAALNLAVVLDPVRNSARSYFLGELLVANLLVAAFYAPWLPVLIDQALPGSGVSSATIGPVAGLFDRLLKTIDNPFPFNGLPWIDIRALPLILLGAWRLRSSDMAVPMAFVLGGAGLMFVASGFHPLLDGKTLAWAGLFAVLVAGIGCSATGHFGLPLVMLVIVVALPAVAAAVDPAPEGWREVAQTFREMAGPGDRVYINYAGAVLPLRHYGWPEEQVDLRVFARRDEETWFRGRPSQIVDPRDVAAEAIRLGRVWLLAYGETRQSDAIAKEIEIETNSVRALHRRTQKLDLSLFDPNSP